MIFIRSFRTIIHNCAFLYAVKMSRARDGDLKENYRESGGHISFHNPNYSCNSGASGGSAEQLERRPNRFQGIFKYDKNQVITSTI